MYKMTVADVAEVIEALREYGYAEMDIASVVDGIEAGYFSVADVADFVYAMEIGDDDQAFMEAVNLGLA